MSALHPGADQLAQERCTELHRSFVSRLPRLR